MQVIFRSSFLRDVKKIKSQPLLDRVRRAIEQVEAAANLAQVEHLKKMSGADNFYRIRIGDYRIGIAVAEGRVEFVRCLSRRDLYRFFP